MTTLLEEHNLRFTSTNYTARLAQYFNELRLQRINNPKLPKLTRDYPTPVEPFYIGSVLTLITQGAYEFTGVIRLDNTLYPEGELGQDGFFNDSNFINDYFTLARAEDYKTITKNSLYYEFIHTKPTASTTLKDWKYAYLPVSEMSAELLNNKVPHLKKWSLETGEPVVSILYPKQVNLISAVEITPLFEADTDEGEVYTHPYLPFMFYLNKSNLIDGGIVLYKYFDSKGYLGPLDTEYYSTLRPLDLRFPLGAPSDDDLIALEECEEYEGFGASWSTYKDEPNKYNFILYKTNSNYSPHTYYLYNREKIETFGDLSIPFSHSYLHEARPHSNANNLITSLKVSNNFQVEVITLITQIQEGESNTQEIFISQSTLPLPIEIQDNTLNVDYVQFVNDYLFFDDNYYINT